MIPSSPTQHGHTNTGLSHGQTSCNPLSWLYLGHVASLAIPGPSRSPSSGRPRLRHVGGHQNTASHLHGAATWRFRGYGGWFWEATDLWCFLYKAVDLYYLRSKACLLEPLDLEIWATYLEKQTSKISCSKCLIAHTVPRPMETMLLSGRILMMSLGTKTFGSLIGAQGADLTKGPFAHDPSSKGAPKGTRVRWRFRRSWSVGVAADTLRTQNGI